MMACVIMPEVLVYNKNHWFFGSERGFILRFIIRNFVGSPLAIMGTLGDNVPEFRNSKDLIRTFLETRNFLGPY